MTILIQGRNVSFTGDPNHFREQRLNRLLHQRRGTWLRYILNCLTFLAFLIFKVTFSMVYIFKSKASRTKLHHTFIKNG